MTEATGSETESPREISKLNNAEKRRMRIERVEVLDRELYANRLALAEAQAWPADDDASKASKAEAVAVFNRNVENLKSAIAVHDIT